MERNTSICIALFLVATLSMVFSNPIQPDMSPPQTESSQIHRCMKHPESGLCLAYFQLYYYNPSKKTCETFIYGGCGGNNNRFLSFEECMSACGDFEATTQEFKLRLEEEDTTETANLECKLPSSSEEEVVKEVEDICSKPAEMGTCRAAMTRYYFNGNDCESFMYGGCDGNGNNFLTVEECRQRCGPKSSEEASNGTESNEAPSSEASVEETTPKTPSRSPSSRPVIRSRIGKK